MPNGEDDLRAVGLVLRAQLRQHGKSWLALAALAALAAAWSWRPGHCAGHRGRFPGFASRYGYDDIVYPPAAAAAGPDAASHPGPPIRAPFVAAAGCASCDAINASQSLDAFELTPRDLARTVKLVSGRMPDQADPGQTLASTTFADDSGVRIGSVIQIYTPTPAQISRTGADQGSPPSPVSWPRCRTAACG